MYACIYACTCLCVCMCVCVCVCVYACIYAFMYMPVCSYLLLLTQYEAVSFCDSVFANYVLLPLQQRHSVLLRKCVWGEHAAVLHCLTLPVNQVCCTVCHYLSTRCDVLSLITCQPGVLHCLSLPVNQV